MFPPPSHKQETPTPSPPPPAVRRNVPVVKLEPVYHPDDTTLIHEGHNASVKDEFMFFDDFTAQTEEPEPEEFFFGEDRQNCTKRRRRPEAPRANNGLRGLHIHALGGLLDRLLAEHRWREAAGVLSVLMVGSSSFSAVTDDDHRRNYVAAMELHRQFRGGEGRRYQNMVQQIYEEWMRKLSWSRNLSIKKNKVQLELALFYSMQGQDEAAKPAMKLIIEECDYKNEPTINLLYGMILYQLWYSSLPEEFKIKNSGSCKPFETYGSVSMECQQSDISVSSHNYYAVDVKDHNYASESSIGNDKVFMDCKIDPPRRKSQVFAAAQGFYISHSKDTNEQKSNSSNPANNLQISSIFFANGLDTNLLPIRLPHMTEDIELCIERYRKLTNDDYRDAVEHLKLALHSTPPVHAALLPLIQLLLLGDRVEEALIELENSCDKLDTALPFRLKARILECFQSNKSSMICSCYENALRRDPLCNQSLERLIQIHKNGNCSTMLMFEMISLHLDAADGKCSIWEEFTACFHGLLAASLIEYEDCTSVNLQRGETIKISTNRIPRSFLEGNVRGTWKLRFEWWKRRHFSSSFIAEQSGDQKLLCFKAACASHLYGPMHDYVLQVLAMLREGDDGHISILRSHMKNSMRLYENL